MKRIARLAAAQRGSASVYHLRLVRNAAWLDIAKYALGSAGFVLSAGLIVVASGAALRIGPVRHADGSAIPSVRPWLESDAPAPPSGSETEGSDNAPMLIAEDPGPEVWSRLISGEEVSPTGATLARPANFVFRPVKIPDLALKAITVQQWPTEMLAAPSVFTGPLLAHTTPDDRSAPVTRENADQPAAVGPQGNGNGNGNDGNNDKGTVPPPKTGSSSTTPTKPSSSSRPPPPAQVTPPPPPSVFLPPPPDSRPPGNPPPPPDQGGSDPVSSVPEPNGWACLLTGFGAIGAVLRRRKGQSGPAPRRAISLPEA